MTPLTWLLCGILSGRGWFTSVLNGRRGVGSQKLTFELLCRVASSAGRVIVSGRDMD